MADWPKRCLIRGCPHSTREGKPFCTDHVDHHPYVIDLLARIDSTAHEVEQIQRRGSKAVRLNSTLVKDLLVKLVYEHDGEASVARLALDTSTPRVVVKAVFICLSRRGVVSIGKVRNGAVRIRAKGARWSSVQREEEDKDT